MASSESLLAQVSLEDLNREWFENPDLAENLGPDCLQLFEASEADFDEVRGQSWYKRVWSTLTGGNTRRLAQGCVNLAQAQQLFLRVLQTHAKSNTKSNVLMLTVARGLRHVENQQNQVVAVIVNLADRLELVEKEVELHRRLLQSDPSNELTWNLEHRLLLFKTMVLVAHADDTVTKGKSDLLDHELCHLKLTGDYLEEAHAFAVNPTIIDQDLERIDSYQVRLAFFRHATGVVYADGELSPAEVACLAQLSKLLGIREVDTSRVRDAFREVLEAPSQARLLKLMSVGKQRATSAPDKTEYQAIDEERERLKREAAEHERVLRDLSSQLVELGPKWAHYAGTVVGARAMFPVLQRFRAYAALEATDVAALPIAFNEAGFVADLKDSLPAAYQLALSFVNELRAIGTSQLLQNELNTTWTQVHEDAGWKAAHSNLRAVGINLIESKPSFIGSTLKALPVTIAGSLLGLGWIRIVAGAAASTYFGKSEEEKFLRAQEQWDSAVTVLLHATDAWHGRIVNGLEKFYLKVIKQVAEGLPREKNIEAASCPLRQMIHCMVADVRQKKVLNIAIADVNAKAHVCIRLGHNHATAGNLSDALECLNQVLELKPLLDPDWIAIAHYNISCYSALGGETSAALEHLSKAVEAGYLRKRSAKTIVDDPDLKSVSHWPGFWKILRSRPAIQSIIARHVVDLTRVGGGDVTFQGSKFGVNGGGPCVGEKIDKGHLKNAKTSYLRTRPGEAVLCLYDSTIFGGAKDGVCFTDRSISWKPLWQEPSSVEYSVIRSLEIKDKALLINGEAGWKFAECNAEWTRLLLDEITCVVNHNDSPSE